MDHEELVIFELDRHDLKRLTCFVITQVEQPIIADPLGRWDTEAETRVFYDVLGSPTNDTVLRC